jgi:hypothetical protein
MSSKRFRQIALKLAGAIEGAHGGHPDFRVSGRIFATMGYPDEQWGMVVLTPDQQAILVEAEPDVFRPVAGAWGKRGSTNVDLAAADPVTLKSALTMAWTNRLAKGGAKQAASKKTDLKRPSAPKAKKASAKRTKARRTGIRTRKPRATAPR